MEKSVLLEQTERHFSPRQKSDVELDSSIFSHSERVCGRVVCCDARKNNSLLHWARLNGSTTAVITEGVEPFKRYAVSVRALYGSDGPGQSRTQHVYTRQGAPSAGPQLQVQTSGSTVKLSWTLPVEQLCGFIRNYTLHYGADKVSEALKVVLPGDVDHFSLTLSPGHYEFFMQASTEAGEGVIGPAMSVHIASEEISIILYIIVSIGVISLVLMLVACLAQKQIVKGTFCRDIPDPSHSSLANWSPKATTSLDLSCPDIKYSEVVLLSDDRETNSFDQPLCHLEAHPPHRRLTNLWNVKPNTIKT
ncbi:hypothetical protein WMY93_016623 [Mugilogobius chulae]|uniref:Fibronectin type-III domain-containing protein n=1 Tax=Mugilogobius chulae TaxID=88201 RepID=A0AAW0NXL5_9GOBI